MVTGILSRVMLLIVAGALLGIVPGVVIVGSVSADAGGNGLADGISVATAVAAFVLVIAALACSTPLRRALRLAPTEALRLS